MDAHVAAANVIAVVVSVAVLNLGTKLGYGAQIAR